MQNHFKEIFGCVNFFYVQQQLVIDLFIRLSFVVIKCRRTLSWRQRLYLALCFVWYRTKLEAWAGQIKNSGEKMSESVNISKIRNSDKKRATFVRLVGSISFTLSVRALTPVCSFMEIFKNSAFICCWSFRRSDCLAPCLSIFLLFRISSGYIWVVKRKHTHTLVVFLWSCLTHNLFASNERRKHTKFIIWKMIN